MGDAAAKLRCVKLKIVRAEREPMSLCPFAVSNGQECPKRGRQIRITECDVSQDYRRKIVVHIDGTEACALFDFKKRTNQYSAAF